MKEVAHSELLPVVLDDMTLANAQAFASAKMKAPVRLSYVSRIGHARTKLRIEVDDGELSMQSPGCIVPDAPITSFPKSTAFTL